jgi:hypothetical protein
VSQDPIYIKIHFEDWNALKAERDRLKARVEELEESAKLSNAVALGERNEALKVEFVKCKRRYDDLWLFVTLVKNMPTTPPHVAEELREALKEDREDGG